jgi:hypothetical protein
MMLMFFPTRKSPKALIPEPNLAAFLTLKVDPNWEASNTEAMLLNRKTPRKETEEATVMKPSAEMLLDNLTQPKTDVLLPMTPNPRVLTELPRAHISRRLRLEPARAKLLIERDDPI